jgi:hypothetical protein
VQVDRRLEGVVWSDKRRRLTGVSPPERAFRCCFFFQLFLWTMLSFINTSMAYRRGSSAPPLLRTKKLCRILQQNRSCFVFRSAQQRTCFVLRSAQQRTLLPERVLVLTVSCTTVWIRLKETAKSAQRVVSNTIRLHWLRFSVLFLSCKANAREKFKTGTARLPKSCRPTDKMIPPPPNSQSPSTKATQTLLGSTPRHPSNQS